MALELTQQVEGVGLGLGLRASKPVFCLYHVTPSMSPKFVICVLSLCRTRLPHFHGVILSLPFEE